MFLRKIPARLVTAIVLLIAMFAGLSTGWYYSPTANAQVQIEKSASPKEEGLSEIKILDKISDDLELEMLSASAEKTVVIVQTKVRPKAALSAAIVQAGGVVRRTFANVNALVMEVPVSSLKSLAVRSDVKYISLDRVAQVTGHIETTTGTSLVRTSGLAGSALDGQGLGHSDS